MSTPIRLNKYLSNAGICSRRKADELIRNGSIQINNQIITNFSYRVEKNDIVKYDNKIIEIKTYYYVLLNKPKGYVTSTKDPHNEQLVTSLIKDASKIILPPVGRLDKDTTGLLLFTNNGDLAHRLCHPSYKVQKVYYVQLNKELNKKDFLLIKEGLVLEDGPAKVDFIKYNKKNEVTVGLHIGKKRIVRRIFSQLNYKVQKLDRTFYGNLKKEYLKIGCWRYLKIKEINEMKKLVLWEK